MDLGLYYSRKGRLISLADWARLQGDREYRIIAQHWVRGWKVSTLWLGLDHCWGSGHRAAVAGAWRCRVLLLGRLLGRLDTLTGGGSSVAGLVRLPGSLDTLTFTRGILSTLII
jgi:hypothetical protein